MSSTACRGQEEYDSSLENYKKMREIQAIIRSSDERLKQRSETHIWHDEMSSKQGGRCRRWVLKRKIEKKSSP
jgi:hypothetical protein